MNILADDQEALSRRFVSKGGQRFEEMQVSLDMSLEIPLLPGLLAALVCDVHSVQEVGDHDVIYGQVIDCSAHDGQPLVYWRGDYAQLQHRREAKSS